MGQIKAIITDFDGTLVNTFMSNFLAYHEVLKRFGYSLSKEQYYKYYGLRFDDLCNALNIKEEDRIHIKELKKEIYPSYFKYVELNDPFMNFLKNMRAQGMKICIASTATKENLYAILDLFKIEEYFDIIITGERVKKGKPDPEVYNTIITELGCKTEEAIVFEDSNVGCEAARKANLNYIRFLNI